MYVLKLALHNDIVYKHLLTVMVSYYINPLEHQVFISHKRFLTSVLNEYGIYSKPGCLFPIASVCLDC